METLSQTGIRANFKTVGFRKNEGYKQKHCPLSALACGSCAAKPAAASQIYRNVVLRRTSVILMATKSGKNKHSDSPAYKELYEAFPEAVLLKKSRKAANKKSQVPDFADEEELVKSLELQFESDMDVETNRHYEIMYLIHEDNANEVGEVVSMVKENVAQGIRTINPNIICGRLGSIFGNRAGFENKMVEAWEIFKLSCANDNYTSMSIFHGHNEDFFTCDDKNVMMDYFFGVGIFVNKLGHL